MQADTIHTTEKRRVPTRGKNSDVRSREYLTKAEVLKVQKAASDTGRYPARDSLMILVAYRHGLRVGELVGLKWDQLDLSRGTVLVKRSKHGDDSTQSLSREEIVGLRKLKGESSFVFAGERGPLTTRAFQMLFKRAGEVAGIDFPIHPHMLRHATGYQLANEGADTRTLQHYLGHKNIQHTVRYTKLVDKRVRELGRFI